MVPGALALGWFVGCNAFRKTEECSVDLDCPRGTSCSVEGSYCKTGGPINIGYLAARTGAQQEVTKERLVGLEFGRWVVERDPSRKVLGRGLAFPFEDTLGTASEVPASARRLFDKNIAALIGPGASGEVLEAQKLTFARQMLHLAPSAGAPAVGDSQPQDPHARFLFQMVMGALDYVPTVPLFLADAKRPANYDSCFDGIAIVVSEDTLGLSIKSALEGGLLTRNCLPITLSQTVPATKKENYTSEIDALLAASKDGKPTRCVFLGLQTDVAGEYLRALKARERTGSRPAYDAFIGAGTLNASNFFNDAKSATAGEPSFAEGFYGIDADGTPSSKTFRDLETLWHEYLTTRPDLAPGTPIGFNRVPYAEAVIVLAIAIELAGTVDDPVALRDAFVDVTSPDVDDLIVGPGDIDAAFARIRAARRDGRRAALDYNGSYSTLNFDSRGFVRMGTFVWNAHDGKIDRLTAFKDEDVAAAANAEPGPACGRKPP